MTKGGARNASASLAIAKGMGITTFVDVLKEIARLGGLVEVETVHQNLLFGGDRTETCRSYFKELWRYGFVDAYNEYERVLELNQENWGPVRKKYRISKRGRDFLAIPSPLKTLALSWYLCHLENPSTFEQIHLTLEELTENQIPLDYSKASDQVGVVRDSIKAILYGWLEPLGFLKRVNGGKDFVLNHDFYSYLSSESLEKLMDKYGGTREARIDSCTIQSPKELDPVAPDATDYVSFHFRYDCEKRSNLRDWKISVNPVFWSRVGKRSFDCVSEDLEIRIPLGNTSTSESGLASSLGVAFLKGTPVRLRLPSVLLTTKSNLQERKILKLFIDLGYDPIPGTKSDRPDMILYPARKEASPERFIHNDELKLLVEVTTIDPLNLTKVEADLNNFIPHTTKVLKINASRTLIIGMSNISHQVYENLPRLIRSYHPFTIILEADLKYLLKKLNGMRLTIDQFGAIFARNGIVGRNEIDNALER